jgi:hypothetical protein
LNRPFDEKFEEARRLEDEERERAEFQEKQAPLLDEEDIKEVEEHDKPILEKVGEKVKEAAHQVSVFSKRCVT